MKIGIQNPEVFTMNELAQVQPMTEIVGPRCVRVDFDPYAIHVHAIHQNTDPNRKGAKAALKQVMEHNPFPTDFIFENGRVYSRRRHD